VHIPSPQFAWLAVALLAVMPVSAQAAAASPAGADPAAMYTSEQPGGGSPCARALQPALPAAVDDVLLRRRIEEQEEKLREQSGVQGAFDSALAEPTLTLAASLQRAGRHAEALSLLARATHVLRVNGGIESAAQIAPLESMLQSQLALRRLDDADTTQARLFRLRRANAASQQERLEAMRGFTRWKCARYLRDRTPAAFRELVAIYAAHEAEMRRVRDDAGLSPAEEVPLLLERMQLEYLVSNYEGERWTGTRPAYGGGAAFLGYQNGGDLDAERFRLLRKHNYRNGRETMERVIALLEQGEARDTQALARAWVALGDWHLWWNQSAAALASYRQAWATLRDDERGDTDPRDLFPQPRVLPEQSPFFAADLADPRVDRVVALVRFDVNRLGEARDIELLEVEAEDERSGRAAVYRMLKASRFRPVLREGRAVDYPDVVRRYAYNYH
jgi:hypothetical protein